MQSLDIQGFSYEERHGLLPTLTSAFADCGGWILDRKTLSPSTMEFRVEIQLRAVIDLYASVIASGRKARGARAVDLLIAATACATTLPLFTRNDDDFANLEGLVEIVAV